MRYKLDMTKKSGIKLVDAISQLPANITELDLSWNNLYDETNSDVVAGVEAIGPTVQTVNLSWNNLGIIPAVKLARIIAALKTVTKLDLSANSLEINSDLGSVFSVIPKNMTEIDIGWNGLNLKGKGNNNTLRDDLMAIPAHVKTIHLTGNNLDQLSLSELLQLKGALSHVEKVYLSFDEIRPMPSQQRDALRNIFPNVKNTIFIDGQGEILRANQQKLAKKLGFPIIDETPEYIVQPKALAPQHFFAATASIQSQKKHPTTPLIAVAM